MSPKRDVYKVDAVHRISKDTEVRVSVIENVDGKDVLLVHVTHRPGAKVICGPIKEEPGCLVLGVVDP